MSELRVVATIPVQPEHAEEMAQALARLAEATRQEEGCISYEAFESQAVPGVFITVEAWRGQEDLDAHMQTEHIAAAIAQLEGKAAGELAIHPLRPVG